MAIESISHLSSTLESYERGFNDFFKKTFHLQKQSSPTFEGNTNDENYSSRRGNKCVLSKKTYISFCSLILPFQ